MKKNSKISVALHSLIHLAGSENPMTSEQLADCSATHPVVIRRILAGLREKGIVKSEKGHGGGWQLAQSYKQISLYDVYISLDESLLPKPDIQNQQDPCRIVRTLQETMNGFFMDANKLLEQRLKKIKIKDIMNQIKQ